jgi:hypothetical protein
MVRDDWQMYLPYDPSRAFKLLVVSRASWVLVVKEALFRFNKINVFLGYVHSRGSDRRFD